MDIAVQRQDRHADQERADARAIRAAGAGRDAATTCCSPPRWPRGATRPTRSTRRSSPARHRRAGARRLHGRRPSSPSIRCRSGRRPTSCTRGKTLQGRQGRAAGDRRSLRRPTATRARTITAEIDARRRQGLPHARRGAQPTTAAHGASSACCRCSIRRARIAPRPSRRPARMGVDIKMVTGDHEAIAREIAGQLKLGQNIVVAEIVFGGRRRRCDRLRTSSRPTASRASFPSTSSRSSRRCRAPATSSA